MNKVIYFSVFLLLLVGTASFAQTGFNESAEIVRFEAVPAKGFTYPYYLYLPKAIREARSAKRTRTILVIPNNSARITDDFAVHENDVKRTIKNSRQIADRLGVAVLMPVFPRPQSDWTTKRICAKFPFLNQSQQSNGVRTTSF